MSQEIRKTTCHGCTRRCGVLLTVENGKPVSVKGDPSQPLSRGFMCARGRALALELSQDPHRLTTPLKRAGKRGEGKWQPISWEQAFTEIAEKLRSIIDESGPEAVGVSLDSMISTGLSFSGNRFARLLGTPNVFTMGGQTCYGNSGQIEMLTYGHDTACDRANSRCTVIWGCNPAWSKPEFFRYIKESKARGGKVIAVDPCETETVKLADLWLQNRPGSSGALMLSWINVIISEDLFDREFVTNWCNAPNLVRRDTGKLLRERDVIEDGGAETFLVWDETRGRAVAYDADAMRYREDGVRAALRGSFPVMLADGRKIECVTVWERLIERVAPYPPETVERISWVPAEKIREAARMYATTRPGNFFPGFAMDVIGFSANQCGRARSVLNAITGNLDVRGGQLFLDGPSTEVRNDPGPMLSPETYARTLGADRFRMWSWEASMKMFKFQKRIGAKLPSPFYGAHSAVVWRSILGEGPYRMRALINVANNPMLSAGHTEIVEKALKALDLLVVQDIYMTPTAELADYVTPAATDDTECARLYTGGYCSGWLETQSFLSGEQAVTPPGEAKTDFCFFRGLGMALGQDWPWENDEAFYGWQLEPLGYSSFKEFHDEVQWSIRPPKYERYKERGFGTPSRKVEIYSMILEDFGYDPLPNYCEPPYSPFRTPELYREYPFIMGAMRPRHFYQSGYRSLPSLKARQALPQVRLHPDAARKLNVKEGDWVRLSSPSTTRTIEMTVHLDSGLDPRVVYPDYGWWYPDLPASENHGVWKSNINVLTDDDPEHCCPMIGGTFLNANLLRLEKV